MRTAFLTIVVLSGFLLLSGCKKERTGSLNCEKLRAGLLANDPEAVRAEIEGFTYALRPDPAASDLYGQRLNIEKLAQALKDECGFSVALGCYNCIKTNPPQTEIYISLTNGATTVHKVIDLSYTNSKRIVFAGMHD